MGAIRACSNCRFYTGLCRRFPPQLVTMTMGRPFPAWPDTDPDAWCGEWRFAGEAEVPRNEGAA